jgi:hypothetical protein
MAVRQRPTRRQGEIGTPINVLSSSLVPRRNADPSPKRRRVALPREPRGSREVAELRRDPGVPMVPTVPPVSAQCPRIDVCWCKREQLTAIQLPFVARHEGVSLSHEAATVATLSVA